MKNFRSLTNMLGFMIVISTSGGCVTEGVDKFFPGEGIPWTFNVTNQSGSAITVKVIPLRSNEGGSGVINNEPPVIVDGPIVEKLVAQGVSESLIIKTGISGGGLGSPVFRSFTFEIMGLHPEAITSFGWPVAGVHNTTIQYYGLGYMYNTGGLSTRSTDRLLSSLVTGHYLSSFPVYNVIVENPNSIKWSLDEKVKLDGAIPTAS